MLRILAKFRHGFPKRGAESMVRFNQNTTEKSAASEKKTRYIHTTIFTSRRIKTRARPSGSRPYKTKRLLHLKSLSTHEDPYVNQFPNKIKRVFHIIVRAKEMRLRFCVHADVVHVDGVPSAGATIRAKRSRHVKGCRNLRHSTIAEPRSSRLRIPHACGIERIRDELIRPVPCKLPPTTQTR